LRALRKDPAIRTLVLGLDAFDPAIFEKLYEQGRMPNLAKYVQAKGYARFSVSNPPQSEVSWTSIATGLNPGGHGIFDFVHRAPATYALGVSLLPTKRGLAGTQFTPPSTARTIFDQAALQGFPAIVLWWPGTFPARPESPVRTVPGLGTPDIHGRLGVGTLFSADAELSREKRKTPVVTLRQRATNCYTGLLSGPIRKTRRGIRESATEIYLDVTGDKSARLTVNKHSIELTEGTWSPILEIPFRIGRFLSVRSLTRVILTQIQPTPRLYALPLQLHPLHSLWRYATPPAFVKQMWRTAGPFLTIGWPQDTTGLEEECITDDQFLDLCESIFRVREYILMHQLQRFHEGILASVFDSLDRIQHMYLRDRPDVVEKWYEKLDALVGRVEQSLTDQGKATTRIITVSDHGFTEFNYRVHLNRWLIQHGHLAPRENDESGSLQDVDWTKSQAYAIGLNSLYLNLVGREGQGCVQPDQKDQLVNRLREALLRWQGPDGRSVVHRVWSQDGAFEGPLAMYGPDLVVGFSPGYRASAQTGLGLWEKDSIESNHDHWGADHCVDPQAVPGILFSNQGLEDFPHPSYHDIPALTIGVEPDVSASKPPPSYSDEDVEVVEERLRSLGYL
jgi:predicted AlkP superfamily phosphohydrolase/phosphomutase